MLEVGLVLLWTLTSSLTAGTPFCMLHFALPFFLCWFSLLCSGRQLRRKQGVEHFYKDLLPQGLGMFLFFSFLAAVYHISGKSYVFYATELLCNLFFKTFLFYSKCSHDSLTKILE